MYTIGLLAASYTGVYNLQSISAMKVESLNYPSFKLLRQTHARQVMICWVMQLERL